MRPINFEESNRTLGKPDSMTDEECLPLPVYTDGTVCVSLWQASWYESLKFLWAGKIWLHVVGSHTQPPVLVSVDSPFTTED